MLSSLIAIDTNSLVPLRRFGSVLHRSRRQTGASMAGLCRVSEGRWLPDALVEVERGHLAMSDDDAASLATVYSLTIQPWLNASSIEFVLDRWGSEGIDRRHPAARRGPSDTQLDVSVRFAALAVALGIDLSTGIFGLDAVAEAMETGRDNVIDLLRMALTDGADEVAERMHTIRERLVVPQAGVLVADCPAGSLVAVRRVRYAGFSPMVDPFGTLGNMLDSAR